MRACKWHIVEFCSFDKIFRFAWHSISFVLSVSKKWLWLWLWLRCVCVCHCCCLYFQFSRSEVYSWYVLYSFRKRTDSRLDPIEDVFTPKHSYFLSVTQDFFIFLPCLFFPLRSVATFSVLFIYFPSFSLFLHFIYFKKCLCLFPKLLFIFPNFNSFLFPSKYLSLSFIWTKHQRCNAFHSYQMRTANGCK